MTERPRDKPVTAGKTTGAGRSHPMTVGGATLTADERKRLQAIRGSGKGAECRKRAHILLLADRDRAGGPPSLN
ncbi:MAG: hypothetical protein OXC91_10380 [Rhodobacteraceae bacterium]|nr:hypothetical protein [Paracoccaceae bacterium]